MTAESSRDNAALIAACSRNREATSVLDIGAGDGELLFRVAADRAARSLPPPALYGIDVDAAGLATAHRRLTAVASGSPVTLVHADATTHPLPHVQLACINPPLLPGGTGFVTADGDLFWQAMLRRLATERFAQTTLLHLFGFHIHNGPGTKFPSLPAVLRSSGLDAIVAYSGLRHIRPTSRIRRTLPELSRTFHRATIYLDGAARQLQDVAPDSAAHLAVDHHVYVIGLPAANRLTYLDNMRTAAPT